MDNMRRVKKQQEEERKKDKTQCTKDKSSMTRTSKHLAGGLLISVGKIIQKESGQSNDFEEAKLCRSQASMTTICMQNRLKR